VVFVNAWAGGPVAGQGGWDVYFHVDDVLVLCERLRMAGATIAHDPDVTVYGMREFDVRDPDENLLCFGEDADWASDR
jgi:uncharacterized glyoxalase superfamily protein PhnB